MPVHATPIATSPRSDALTVERLFAEGTAEPAADPVEQHSTSNESTDDEARAFLQGRLAYLGKIYAFIGISFYLVGNLADASLRGFFVRKLAEPMTWIVPAASLLYLAQWAICRGAARPLGVLRAVDATTTVVAALLHSMMLFSFIPNELPGLSYARALLLVTFGLLVRAIVIPSSPARTLTVSLLAAAGTVISSHFWYMTNPAFALTAGTHAIWTSLWCLGIVVVATLASHVIFGLRQQVREAWQLGQYTLLERIGEGGMGAVYRASHAMLRRPTAVKLLRAARAGPQQLERFEREVQLTSLLTHPNTVSIFDYGRTPDGVFYYAMEYLDGLNLEDLVRLDGPQPPGRVAHILRQVAGSLAEAHRIGLIHRDIKPANVILVAERGGVPDVAKVVDFGLVKQLDSSVAVTIENEVAGTPHYLAPEILSSPEDVGPQSDLYSLGCVGYYLLTGHTVFEGDSIVEVCTQHLHSRPVPPRRRIGRHLPESLSRLLMACLEKAPADRPSSVNAFIDLLDACDDVRPWTHAMGQRWWLSRGVGALTSVRQQRARDGGGRAQVATTLPKVSFIRPRRAAPRRRLIKESP